MFPSPLLCLSCVKTLILYLLATFLVRNSRWSFADLQSVVVAVANNVFARDCYTTRMIVGEHQEVGLAHHYGICLVKQLTVRFCPTIMTSLYPNCLVLIRLQWHTPIGAVVSVLVKQKTWRVGRWGWTWVGIPQQIFSGLIIIGSVNMRYTRRFGHCL